jgi:hypothetical protein
MQVRLRRAAERGQFDHGWLRTAHTFSFADYHDPAHVRFRSLRVLNEDHIAPGAGFGLHPHRDMEILTWVLAGALQHEDDMGHRQVIRPGEVQVMSAGTGVQHSERNPSDDAPVHLLQIWILPDRRGLPPRYEQRRTDPAQMDGRLLLLAAPPDRHGVVTIHQDAYVYGTRLRPGQRLEHPLAAGRGAWVQVARGSIAVAGADLVAGDGAAIDAAPAIDLVGTGPTPAEVLLFDLA